MFSIVEFLESDEVSLVPTKWISGGNCKWPPPPQDPSKAIKKNVDPGNSWNLFKIRVLKTTGLLKSI